MRAAYANPFDAEPRDPSISSRERHRRQSVEDMGGGYKGNFVLEGQFASDTGCSKWQEQPHVGSSGLRWADHAVR